MVHALRSYGNPGANGVRSPWGNRRSSPRYGRTAITMLCRKYVRKIAERNVQDSVDGKSVACESATIPSSAARSSHRIAASRPKGAPVSVKPERQWFSMPRTEHGLRGAIQRSRPSQQIPLGMRDANSKFQRRKHRHSMSMEQSSADASEKMRRRFWPPRACMKRFPAMEAFNLARIGRRHF